jgi:hypothetical protein
MAISVIPIIYNVVDKAITENISVSFVLTDVDEFGNGNITTGTYDKLVQYIDVDESLEVILYVDDELINPLISEPVTITNHTVSIGVSAGGPYDIDLFNDDTFATAGLLVEENMTIRIEFELQTNGVWTILLSLIPLVFVGGLIVYFVKKNDLNA